VSALKEFLKNSRHLAQLSVRKLIASAMCSRHHAAERWGSRL